MKKHLLSSLAVAMLSLTAGVGQSVAAPVTLGGMGITSQWTDFENASGELPSNPWANSDVLNANRVGIYVEYLNGLTGSATYSGTAGQWGGCCNVGSPAAGITPDSATGFFVGGPTYALLHGLDNSGPGFPLPMAWTDLQNAFTGNFDISYENQGNSTWRAESGGWESVQITLYSSTAPAAAVPEPASLALVALSLIGLGATRRRKQ